MNSDLIFKGGVHYITSPFGNRTHPITKKVSFHNGVDYGTHLKKIPVYAVADGTVRINRFETGAGNYVSIGHTINGKEYRALYMHLDKLSDLKVGARVKKGDKVGIVGTTGNSTGIHLHFGWFDVSAGKHIDFEKFIFPTSDKYIVKAGDVLWKIAEQWGMNWEDVWEYNKSATFKDPGTLKIGQVILKPIQSDTATKECQGCVDTQKEVKRLTDTLKSLSDTHKRDISTLKGHKELLEVQNDDLMIKIGELKEDNLKLSTQVSDLQQVVSLVPKRIFVSPATKKYKIKLQQGYKLYLKKQG